MDQTNSGLSARGKTLALTGAVLQLGQFAGIVGSTIGAHHVSQMLQSSPSDIANPVQLADAIGDALLVTAIGLGISIIGVVLLVVALLGSRYRALWFFWFLTVYGGLALFHFPLGTLIGVFFLFFCLVNRNEFFRANRKELNGSANSLRVD